MLSFEEFYLESSKTPVPLEQKRGHLGFTGKVFVYYNINLSQKLKSPFFSIKDTSTGKVIGHDTKIMLRDATFKVLESGRQRVIATGRKNVHAGAVGFISEEEPRELSIKVTYNPYKYNSFVKKEDETPIKNAKLVSFLNKSVTAEI